MKTLRYCVTNALVLLVGCLLFAQDGAMLAGPTGAANGDWPVYAADLRSTKYSTLDLINPTNVRDLRIVWRWKSPDIDIVKQNPSLHLNLFEATPLAIDGVLYVITNLHQIAAIDAATGTTRWLYDPGVYRLGTPERTGSGEHAPRSPRHPPQAVAQLVPEPDVRAAGEVPRGVERHHLRERPREVRRDAGHEQVALERALVGDADLAAREVAKAAVDELRAPAAGAEREVVLFDQRNTEPTSHGVESDTDTGDSAADDQDVNRIAVRQLLELTSTPVCIES